MALLSDDEQEEYLAIANQWMIDHLTEIESMIQLRHKMAAFQMAELRWFLPAQWEPRRVASYDPDSADPDTILGISVSWCEIESAYLGVVATTDKPQREI